MPFDELEWLRDRIDRWLASNAPALGIAAALLLAVASLWARSSN